jgi:type I restriction enzyme S subunit
MLLAMTEQAEGLLGSALFVPENNRYLHNQRLGLVQILNQEKFVKTFCIYFLIRLRSGSKLLNNQQEQKLNILHLTDFVRLLD